MAKKVFMLSTLPSNPYIIFRLSIDNIPDGYPKDCILDTFGDNGSKTILEYNISKCVDNYKEMLEKYPYKFFKLRLNAMKELYEWANSLPSIIKDI